MSAYYNEIDPFAAEWLRRLIAAGHIAAGDVDERSIAEVKPDDLKGYTQCHFFAGIGVWSYALRRAGWADDRPVWTGSCPCQPFSAAGKGEGTDDARHLWPEWFRLIGERRPVAVFGEQVSAAIRHDWLDLVSADLEGLDYAVGSAVLGAHSVGAPHIRQRLYFVGTLDDTEGTRRGVRHAENNRAPDAQIHALADADRGAACAGGRRHAGGMEHAASDRREQRRPESGGRCAAGGCGQGGVALGDTHDARPQGHRRSVSEHDAQRRQGTQRHYPAAGFWDDCDWLPCIDGKARPVEPGTFPLAHGVAGRVGRLRAYGNAICAETAREFIEAYLAR